MPTVGKILGQSMPGAATLTDTYAVPPATSAIVTSIIAANQSSTATSIRVSVAVAGAPDTSKQYITYDFPIAAHYQVVVFSGAMTLGALDKIRCYCTLATVSFNVFGQEITA